DDSVDERHAGVLLDVERRHREPRRDLLRRLQVEVDDTTELIQRLRDRGGVLLGRRSELDAHAPTSSRASDSRRRSGSSFVGSGPGRSPSRLIQIERTPKAFAGAMSWNRLAATCTSGGQPTSRSNVSQWASAGLYEPISEATIARSNGAPRCFIDASMKSRSVLERI